MPQENDFQKQVRLVYHYLLLTFCIVGLIFVGVLYFANNPSSFSTKSTDEKSIVIPDVADTEIVSGIHVATGFKEGTGLTQVIENCTNCHAAALVTQNRMSREGWVATIRWMQKTQNLWDLGENEALIVDYLATHYAPEEKGRRQNLEAVEWYSLEP